MTEIDSEQRELFEGRYVRWFALFAACVSLLPFVYAVLVSPPGSHYVGYQYNTDDHMVYAAWMRQAMDGHFLFDNRFAVDQQPGLSVNIYFFLLGLLAKVITIPVATALARAGFSALFIFLMARLLRKVPIDVYTTKLAITLTALGAGIGFLVWHNFGQLIIKPEAQMFSGIMGGRLPTDVWQPEGYVLPSMLTNSLFMVSLCLIITIFLGIIEAKDSWKPVFGSALAMGALMNIHSYDALMIAFVMAGFLVAAIVRKQATPIWVLRAAIIGAGAVLPALWFLHVLELDPVFQARASTPTFAPNFRQVVFGYLPMIGLAFVGLVRGGGTPGSPVPKKQILGAGLLGVMILAAFVLAGNQDPNSYWMSMGVWSLVIASAIICVALLARDEPVWNLFVAWAAIGIFAPYFPALFERKLAMGLSIPWAVLAAIGLGVIVARRDRGSRNLATILGIVVVCGSSILWVIRETNLAKNNVSSTTFHAVYLSSDAQRIVNYLQDYSSKHAVVIAMPGVKNPVVDQSGNEVPDLFETPYVPDLNPILSGLSGVYTYAGHWSETPEYGKRRGRTSRFFDAKTPPEYRAMFINDVKPQFIVAPVPEAFPQAGIADLTSLGEVVIKGTQFSLIKVN